MKSANDSQYIIDNKALENLHNDPQGLIQCTQPGDRVEFALIGVQKFNRTLAIFHELELVTKSSHKAEISKGTHVNAVFACPKVGPFLAIE